MLADECTIWSGGKTGLGYGQVRRGGKQLYAHRIAYAEYNGLSIDDLAGVVIRHKCDNPSCVNPLHLEPGTQADNMRDMRERGRYVCTEDERQRRSQAQKDRFALVGVSDETRKRMSEAHKGYVPTPEQRAKIAAAGRGRRATEETRARLRSAWVLRKQLKETAPCL